MAPELEQWLKGTVWGMIILGGIGSIVAVFVLKAAGSALRYVRNRLAALHLKIFVRAAFMQGYSAATVHHDRTGRWLTTLVAFRAVRVVVAVQALSVFVLSFIVAAVTRDRGEFSWFLFIPALFGFLTLYWLYYEWEYFYRVYWTYWRQPFEHAEEGYRARNAGSSRGDPTDDGSLPDEDIPVPYGGPSKER